METQTCSSLGGSGDKELDWIHLRLTCLFVFFVRVSVRGRICVGGLVCAYVCFYVCVCLCVSMLSCLCVCVSGCVCVLAAGHSWLRVRYHQQRLHPHTPGPQASGEYRLSQYELRQPANPPCSERGDCPCPCPLALSSASTARLQLLNQTETLSSGLESNCNSSELE